MYEMYPERWAEDDSTTHDGRRKATAERPRRRARKSHRVTPQIIADLEHLRGPAD